jgi:hypothetical protein
MHAIPIYPAARLMRQAFGGSRLFPEQRLHQ